MTCKALAKLKAASRVVVSLIPRPSTSPVFDRLQFTVSAIKNWRCGRPGNEDICSCSVPPYNFSKFDLASIFTGIKIMGRPGTQALHDI